MTQSIQNLTGQMSSPATYQFIFLHAVLSVEACLSTIDSIENSPSLARLRLIGSVSSDAPHNPGLFPWQKDSRTSP